jgi:hypothetical protein
LVNRPQDLLDIASLTHSIQNTLEQDIWGHDPISPEIGIVHPDVHKRVAQEKAEP